MTPDAAAQAHQQYGNSTQNLDLRLAIHSYGTNTSSWPDFVRSRLPLLSGAAILDVGAGTGVHWREPTTARPVLLDRHAPMCESLRTLRYPVVQASADVLPIASSTFDGVLCTHVLYHVPDPGAAIDEMLRVVRPGGWLALATNGPQHMAELDTLRRSVGVVVERPHHEHFSIDDAVAALTSRGLDPVRHDFEDDLEVTDAPVVVGYCQSLGHDLTSEQHQQMTALVQEAIDGVGHYRITKETALLVANT